jgi:hypothetical protein
MHGKSFDPPASAGRRCRNTTGWAADRDAADIEIAADGATCKSIICRPILPYFEKVLSNLRAHAMRRADQPTAAVLARALSSPLRESFRETAGTAFTMMVAPTDQRGR